MNVKMKSPLKWALCWKGIPLVILGSLVAGTAISNAPSSSLTPLASAGISTRLQTLELMESLTQAYKQLITYYDWKTGFFGDDSGGLPLWTTANQLETVANYYALTHDISALDIFENSYAQLKPR
jgi:hypothetical protein